MVELEFHCCMCGEENVITELIEIAIEKEEFYFDCLYCKERLTVTIESRLSVTNVDCE